MSRLAMQVVLAALFMVLPTRLNAAPVVVEASDLTKRADLVGRELLVDDRFALFVFHKGKGYDEVVLQRAEGVTFHLAQNLRPAQAPRPAGVRVQGVLQKQGNQLTMEVVGLELLPPDLERLDAAVASLGAGDFAKRSAWARWAQARAESFSDEPLKERARKIAADALWIEAGKLPETDRSKRWLALAERGRKENAAEPIPSALAHRAFRSRLADDLSAAQLEGLIHEVETFFPNAKTPLRSEVVPPLEPDQDVGVLYQEASPARRHLLDRGLFADVVQAWIERDFSESPARGLELADRARSLLPDRPKIAEKLKTSGLSAAASSVGKLSLREVEALAARYRDEQGQPQQSRDLLRKWLDDRRENRLSSTDSDGRVQLAFQYDRLLGDRSTAVLLLRAALVIDPQSKEIADAFRRFGYRKVDEAWVETGGAKTKVTETTEASKSADDVLVTKGMTREQVRTRLGGKPDRIVRVATQGQILEQWIYQGAKGMQLVNFQRGSDRPEPRVTNYYTLP